MAISAEHRSKCVALHRPCPNKEEFYFTLLQNYGTMELWFTMENYGTIDKTMVLWTKLWYYTRTMELRSMQGKNHGRLPKTKTIWIKMGKNSVIYQKQLKFLNKFIALEYWFTMEKLWYYGKNYSTKEKTMILYPKLWNFDFLWKNYGSMGKTMEL